MKFFIASLVILLNLFSNITSILQCFVKENSSNEQRNCVFPFALVTDPDVVYNECTKIHDSFGKYWCSTKVSDGQDFGICLLQFKLLHLLGLNFMSGSTHIQSVLIDAKYRNCRGTLDVYLLLLFCLDKLNQN